MQKTIIYRKINRLMALLLAVCLLSGCVQAAPADMPAKTEAAASDGATVTPASAEDAPEATAPADANTPAPDWDAPDATPEANTPTPEGTEGQEAVRTLYEAVLDCDPEKALVTGQLRVTYYNDTTDVLYQLALRLWPNAIEKGCMDIQSMTLDNMDTKYDLDATGTVLYVPLRKDLDPGDTVTLFMQYRLSVPETRDRFGMNELGMQLGNAMPILSLWENGAWRTDAYETEGDSFYSQVADYKVVVRCPEIYSVAATGNVEEARMAEGMYEAYYLAPRVREFAVMLTKSAFLSEAETKSGVKVYGQSNLQERADFLAQNAAAAMDFYEEKIGPYPYASLNAVGGVMSGGMEYPGLILLDNERLAGVKKNMGELYIAHEIAHQWFYAAVGSDPLLEPWVDEAVCEYLSFAYIESIHGAEYTDGLVDTRFSGMSADPPVLRMDAPLSAFAKKGGNEYLYNVYGRGLLLYRALYGELGDAAFYNTLRTLYVTHMFGEMTGQDIKDAFSAAAGSDLSQAFEYYQQPLAVAEAEASW